MKPGHLIEDIPPQIKIITLVDDPAILMKGEFGATVNGRAGPSPEHHLHLPFKENLIPLFHDRGDVHLKLLTSRGQSFTQRLEVLNPIDPLNAIFKDDVFMVVGKDMGPVWLSLAIVRLRPEIPKPFRGQWFQGLC